jgi:hypothetical protein
VHLVHGPGDQVRDDGLLVHHRLVARPALVDAISPR